MIDNSPTMAEEQAALAAAIPEFISGLEGSLAGLPSLHIGIVSSDMGAGIYDVANCKKNGLDGELQSLPRLPNCSAPSDRFIIDVVNADGFTRERNYSGTLAETLACIAPLGATGCGFSQPFAAVQRALDPAQATNVGFFRNEFLLVVFVSDQDDCSVADDDIFNPAAGSLTTFGPMTTFRCSEFGVTCAEGNLSRSAASYTGCRPRQGTPYLQTPEPVITFLKNRVPDTNKLLVATIVGAASPVRVSVDDSVRPVLEPVCTSQGLSAKPGVRFKAFGEAFPNRFVAPSLCGGFGPALAEVAELATKVLDGQAPPVPLPDAGPSSPAADAANPGEVPDGGPSASSEKGGCGCAVGGAASSSVAYGFGVLLVLSAALGRVRRRRRK